MLLKTMNKSKKGITLVELVICCAVMVILAGGCVAVLLSGQRLFLGGSRTANNQLDANVLQTTILNALPEKDLVQTTSIADAEAMEEGVCFYFTDDTLVIRMDKVNMTVNKVKDFTFAFKKAGESTSNTAKAHFTYIATLSDGSQLKGGMSLSNVRYYELVSTIEDDLQSGDVFSLKGEDRALTFSIYVKPEVPGGT